MDRERVLPRAAFVAVFVLYTALRFWKLSDSCLWFDEIFSVHAAEHDWSSIFQFAAADLIHPPFFYILLKFWISIGGESTIWLRSLPVILSLLAVAPFLLFCREIKLDHPARLLSFFLISANGSLIKYSQEVRMYSLLLFLSLASLWLFSRYFNRGKGINSLTLVNLLLVYTHYFGWFVIIAEVTVILFYQRIKIRSFLFSILAVLVGFLPWMTAVVMAAIRGADINENIGWVQRPGVPALLDLVLDTIEPFYFQSSSIDPTTIWYITFPILLLVLIGVTLSLPGGNKTGFDERPIYLFILVPVSAAFVLSWVLPISIWGSRHLIIVVVPTLILIAAHISRLSHATVRIALICGLISISLTAFVMEATRPKQTFIWCAWERLITNVQADQPQTVYSFEDLVAYHLWFAERANPNISIIKITGIPGMNEDKAYFLPREFEGVRRLSAFEMKGDHFWVAFRDMKWNEKHPPIGSLLEAGYLISQTYEIDAQGMKAYLVEVQH